MFEKLLITLLIGGSLGTLISSSKIDPSVRKLYQSKAGVTANIFLFMNEGNEKALHLHRLHSKPLSFYTRAEQIASVQSELKSHAKTSQNGVLSILEKNKANFTSFWISNQVFIPEAPWELLLLLEKDPQVASIRQEEIFQLSDQIIPTTNNSLKATSWGIDKIQAPEAWGLNGGNRGEGVIVSIIDTGVLHTHEALRNNFRADYGWYDPYEGSHYPIDRDGHGTHVMGTIVGANGIGVAPGAQWIACRGCNTEGCSQSALQACGQWVFCPTRTDGSGADCSKAPHLVSNSWGGGQGSTTYLSVVNAWHEAGIIPIFAIGNAGYACGTAMSPGDLDNVIGVGSTDSDDMSSSFSSLGPTVNGQMKPDISAPGSQITSAWSTGDSVYRTISGTSMATPHVAGVVALLLGKNPNLDYDKVKSLLQDNTDKELVEVGGCGGVASNVFPNNVYGHGRLNAQRSLEALLKERENTGSAANSLVSLKISLTISVGLIISRWVCD